MNDWPHEIRQRREGVTIPTIWVAIIASVLLHTAALWTLLPQLRPMLDKPEHGDQSAPLVVQITPPPGQPPAPPPAPPPAQPRAPTAPPITAEVPPRIKVPAPKAAPRPQQERPVIAMERKGDVPAPQAAAKPAPAAKPPAEDLSSYIEARRRARSEQGPPPAAPPAAPSASASGPPEDENTRANRIASANLGLDRAPTFGRDPTPSGGIFTIERLTSSDAEFLFYGWNKDIRRNTIQRIEVRKGENSDIRIAVVRRMIVIIREYEKEDFLWESRRLGRNVTLSARQRDSAGLEDFMMREFFFDPRQRFYDPRPGG